MDEHTGVRSKVLIALSIAALHLGVFGLILAGAAVSAMSHDDVAHLEAVYNPNGPATYQVGRTYENLYDWAEGLLHDRNRFARQLLQAVSLSFLAVGVVLMLWSIDRERLRRDSAMQRAPSREDGA